jgi:hypothetical protein
MARYFFPLFDPLEGSLLKLLLRTSSTSNYLNELALRAAQPWSWLC